MTQLHHSFSKIILFAGIMFAATSEAFGALDVSYYTQESLLSSGKWVKVKVRGSGIHQITDAELQAMGFDDPTMVTIHGYSGTALASHCLNDKLPDDLPQVTTARVGDRLLFYSDAYVRLSLTTDFISDGTEVYVGKVERNYFNDYAVYYLTDAIKPSAPAVGKRTESNRVVTTSNGLIHLEDEVYDPTIGARFLGKSFVDEPMQEFELTLPGYTGNGRVNMQYLLGLRMNANSNIAIELLDGSYGSNTFVPARAAESWHYAGEVFTYSLTKLPVYTDGTYFTSVSVSADRIGTGGIEYITIIYPRNNELTEKVSDKFYFPVINTGDEVRFTNANANTMVWDVTDPVNAVALEVEHLEDGMIAVNAPERSTNQSIMIAFDSQKEFPGIEDPCEVPNQNLHGATSVPRMIIVSAREFLGEAQRLANIHIARGEQVEVIPQELIYNEFSSGIYHPMAVRRYLRMLRDRFGDEALRSLLIIGAGTYDNRGIHRPDQEAFRNITVPMFSCEDFTKSGHYSTSFCTDAYYGMLSEDEDVFDISTKMIDINVSRIPATSTGDAIAYIDRVDKYLNQPSSPEYAQRVALFCDDGDQNGHMSDAEAVADIVAQNSPHSTVYRAYNTIYPFTNNSAVLLRKHLTGAFARGVGYAGYSGHASLAQFGTESVWNQSLAQSTAYSHPPFIMLATCRGLYFDHDASSVGESWFKSTQGGCIAMVGSLREVYKEQNQHLNVRLAKCYFTATPGTTMGDVFRLGRNETIRAAMDPWESMTAVDRKKLPDNTLCYNMVGDPEIPLVVSDRQMELTAISDVEPSTAVTMGAGRTYLAAGRVMKPGSTETDTDFNGTGVINIYDGAKTMKVINGVVSTDPAEVRNATVKLDEDLIYERKFEIVNGEFSADIYLPVPGQPGLKNRITLFGSDDDRRIYAMGSNKELTIGSDAGAEEPDQAGVPQIESIYLNSPAFAEGDLVGKDAVLYATVSPDSYGISASSTLLGRSLTLTLDGNTQLENPGNFFTSDVSGGGRLQYPLNDLRDGRHTLTLRVFNYAGLSATRSITFESVAVGHNATLEVAEVAATEQATISLNHDFKGEPSGRLTITDAAGEVVFSDPDAVFPYQWPLITTSGKNVADGLYTARAYLRDETSFGISKETEIVVRRSK